MCPFILKNYCKEQLLQLKYNSNGDDISTTRDKPKRSMINLNAIEQQDLFKGFSETEFFIIDFLFREILNKN